MDPLEISSEWDRVDDTYEVEGNILDLDKKVKVLAEAFPNQLFEVEVAFETYAMLEKFENKLEAEEDIFNSERHKKNKNDFDTLFFEIFKKTLSSRKKDIENLRMFQILFQGPVELSIFFQNYCLQINFLQKQYNYLILPFRRRLAIYLQNKHEKKISQFFLNQIFDMRRKLIIHRQDDPEIFKKMLYSKIAGNQLQKLKIKFLIVPRFMGVAFYSTEYPSVSDLKKQVRKFLSYHISVIKLPQIYVDSYILQELLKLIVLQIRPALNQIQKNLQMPIEVNIEKLAIIVNDQHEVFNDGVITVRQSMKDIKLIELECQSLSQLKKTISKSQYSKCLRFQFRFRKCFMLFSDELISQNRKAFQKFLSEISVYFKAKYRLIIHLVHLEDNQGTFKSEIQRITRLAVLYQFNMPVFHNLHLKQNYHKIVIEPKQFGIYAENVRSLIMKMFLTDFIYVRQLPQHVPLYPTYEQNLNDSTERSQMELSQSRFQENLNNSISYYSEKGVQESVKYQTEDVSSVKNDFFTLNIQFQVPEQTHLDGQAYKLRKRNREIEDYLEKRWNRRLKVSKIILNSEIKLPEQQFYSRYDILGDIFKQLQGFTYGIKSFSESNHKSIKQFEQNEKGFICFINEEINQIMPLYEVQFVN